VEREHPDGEGIEWAVSLSTRSRSVLRVLEEQLDADLVFVVESLSREAHDGSA
jgi:hypothetical protein